MAVLNMCKINICAMKKNRKKILELLQKKGCLEIHEEVQEDSVFGRMNTATQISIFERNAAQAENALEIMENYFPQDRTLLSSLEGKKQISQDEYEQTVQTQQEVMSLVNNVIQQKKKIDERETAIDKCREEIQALQPWLALDVPMNFRGTKNTGFMTGSISGTYTQEMLTERLEKMESLPKSVYLQVVRADKYQTYVTCVFMKDEQEKMEKALRELSFGRPPVMVHHIPEQSVKNRESRIEEYKLDIENTKAEIEQEADQREAVKKIADYYRVRAQKYKVVGEILQSKHTFFVSGYMPQKEVGNLKQTLEDKFTVAFDVEEPGKDEDVPVLLTNGKVGGAVEGVVTAFGYPNKTEFDPTTITSFFYYFLFGIMLSDGAYGFIMFLACFILVKKFPNMEESMAKTFRMFMYCGLSTLIWGILFGGYFGDAVTVIGKTFFDVNISIPALWFEPIVNPMKMLIYCLGFGIIHLFTGLGIKGYMMIKQKDIAGFVCDVVFWYVFLIGLILLLLPTEMFASLASVHLVFPAWLSLLSKIMALGGMLGILLMAGRRAKNPVKRLMLGAYSLYDTTGWLSDLLSYSRLLALGLATGVIAQVINTMASMGGKSISGVILFIIVFIFGHTFNMAINLLGAYVHTNRLQFVEFFGKFYEGGGREFKPFKANTKYINVKEN
ncbi:MAG: V-type ATP synthase subunit I [Eubacterium sp.]